MGHKKEKSLLDRALAKEEINLAEYSLEEVKKVIEDLVELQLNKIHREEIIRLQDAMIMASEKVKKILQSEK